MEDWYDNKQLYEMLRSVQQDMANMRKEMAETRTLIRDYNDLRQKVGDTASKINMLMWITPIAVAATGLLLSFLNFIVR